MIRELSSARDARWLARAAEIKKRLTDIDMSDIVLSANERARIGAAFDRADQAYHSMIGAMKRS